ncbi:MAG TPA: hypothetical protein VMQ78_07470 [Candidatus Limnocylindria bacterium]|nr:hypothetical protein [Candidatus Limnocylindria bacterium]
MTPLRLRFTRAVVMALMIVALTASGAAASDGGSNVDSVPYDPGLPSSVLQDLLPSGR